MSFEKRKAQKRYVQQSKPWLKANKPPQDEMWAWYPISLITSYAWQAAPAECKLFIMRLLTEHHQHAAWENGNLQLTYDQIELEGISRRHIRWAIDCAISLGFVRQTSTGSSNGRYSKSSRYALTFRPISSEGMDDNLPTNEWKRFKSINDAVLCLPKKKTKNPISKEISQYQGVTEPVSGCNYEAAK